MTAPMTPERAAEIREAVVRKQMARGMTRENAEALISVMAESMRRGGLSADPPRMTDEQFEGKVGEWLGGIEDRADQ